MLDDIGWKDLCRRFAAEEEPQKRLALLAEMERAAREEQNFLKKALRPRVERYLDYLNSRLPRPRVVDPGE